MKIEKDIPVPETRGRPSKSRYPLDGLKVGESFLVPYTPGFLSENRFLNNLHSAVSHRARRTTDRTGITVKYAVRVVRRMDGVLAGARVWRTE